jgi:hypothetical protein
MGGSGLITANQPMQTLFSHALSQSQDEHNHFHDKNRRDLQFAESAPRLSLSGLQDLWEQIVLASPHYTSGNRSLLPSLNACNKNITLELWITSQKFYCL